MGWLCDDDECDYNDDDDDGDDDDDDNDGNDDGDTYDTWVRKAISVKAKFCFSQVVRNFVLISET